MMDLETMLTVTREEAKKLDTPTTKWHVEQSHDRGVRVTCINIDWKYVCFFEFIELPWANMLYSYGTYVQEAFRRKGYGNKMQLLKKNIAKRLGVDGMIALVKEDNHAQQNLIRKHGWTLGYVGKHLLWGKEIPKGEVK